MSEAVPHTISSAQFDTEPGAGSFASCGAASCTSASAIPTPVVRFLPRERGELSMKHDQHIAGKPAAGEKMSKRRRRGGEPGRLLLIALVLPSPVQSQYSAQWFHDQGVERLVAGTDELEVPLRSLQTAARLLSDLRPGEQGRVQDRQLSDLVQEAARQALLQRVARRVGASRAVHVQLQDAAGPVNVSWWLGLDLRDVADEVCCFGSTQPLSGRDAATEASEQLVASSKCFELGSLTHAVSGAESERGEGESSGSETACSSYVARALTRAEDEFRDGIRGAGKGKPLGVPTTARPPRYMPADLEDDFLEECSAGLEYMYRDDSYSGYYQRYSRPYLEVMARMVQRRAGGTNYPAVDALLYRLLTPCQDCRSSDPNFSGARGRVWERMQGEAVVVVGSVVPWYEVMALQYGASHTLTLEYNEVAHDHPKMQVHLCLLRAVVTGISRFRAAVDRKQSFEAGHDEHMRTRRRKPSRSIGANLPPTASVSRCGLCLHSSSECFSKCTPHTHTHTHTHAHACALLREKHMCTPKCMPGHRWACQSRRSNTTDLDDTATLSTRVETCGPWSNCVTS